MGFIILDGNEVLYLPEHCFDIDGQVTVGTAESSHYAEAQAVWPSLQANSLTLRRTVETRACNEHVFVIKIIVLLTTVTIMQMLLVLIRKFVSVLAINSDIFVYLYTPQVIVKDTAAAAGESRRLIQSRICYCRVASDDL